MDLQITLGAQYKGRWRNLSGAEGDCTTDSTGKARADEKVALYLKGGAFLWDVFGAEIGCGPYMRGHYNPTENPVWRLYIGVDAYLRAILEIPFMDRYDYTWGPWRLWEKQVAHAKIDPTLPETPEINTELLDWDDNWQNGPVTLNFTGYSWGRNPWGRTDYRVNGGTWKKAPVVKGTKTRITIAEERDNLVEYRSFDTKGNEEPVKTVNIRIDNTPPTLTLGGTGPAWHKDSATLTIKAADSNPEGLNFADVYDNGTLYRPQLPIGTYIVDGDGPHTIASRVFDKAMNASPRIVATINVDALPPQTIVGGADDSWHSAPVTLTFTAGDSHNKVAGSGVAYTEFRTSALGVWSAWTRGTATTISTNGDHAVEYRSVDNVGHVEPAKTCHVRIDTSGGDAVAPTTTVSGAPAGWVRTPAKLTFTTTDPAPSSGVAYTEYRVGAASGAAPTGDWTRATSVTIADDGDHQVQYRSVDYRGNVEAAKTTRARLDLRAPAASVAGADEVWHDSDVILTFSAEDPTPGSGMAWIEYRIGPRSGAGPTGSWTRSTAAAPVVHAPVQARRVAGRHLQGGVPRGGRRRQRVRRQRRHRHVHDPDQPCRRRQAGSDHDGVGSAEQLGQVAGHACLLRH